MNKVLICYFSATNTTKNVAQELFYIIDGNLFEIEPIKKYTSNDLDWLDEESRTTKESKTPSIRPEIVDKKIDLEEYDKIMIGFPIWWYKEPNIIDTFIEKYNFENKKIYIFCTSGGTDVTNAITSIKEKYPSLNIISGKTLNANLNKDEIISWIG